MSDNISSAFHDYLRSLTDEQWTTLVAEVRPTTRGVPSLAETTADTTSEPSRAASGGLKEGADLYKRGGDIEYDNPVSKQRKPAIEGMSAGADLYARMHSKTTD